MQCWNIASVSVHMCSLGPSPSLVNSKTRFLEFFPTSLQSTILKNTDRNAPGKLYLWDFVCQESQSTGQPKKKRGREKKRLPCGLFMADFMIEQKQIRRCSQHTCQDPIFIPELLLVPSLLSPSKKKKNSHLYVSELFTRPPPCVVFFQNGSQHIGELKLVTRQ